MVIFCCPCSIFGTWSFLLPKCKQAWLSFVIYVICTKLIVVYGKKHYGSVSSGKHVLCGKLSLFCGMKELGCMTYLISIGCMEYFVAWRNFGVQTQGECNVILLGEWTVKLIHANLKNLCCLWKFHNSCLTLYAKKKRNNYDVRTINW